MNVRRLFPFTLFALILGTAVRPTVDPDMWWHLRTGQWISDNGIPRHDIYSFTFPDNEWVTHEWLSEILMWGLYRIGELPALMVFFAAVTALTWWIVYRLCPGKPYVAGMTVAVAAKASEVVWGSRPQLFNLLLFALFIYLLERRRDGSLGGWVFVAFPLIIAVWANLHSGFLLGIVLLGTYLVGEYVEGRRAAPVAGTLTTRDLARLTGSIGACLIAALANPNGARLLVYPFETLASSVQREFISEWFPPRPGRLVFWLAVVLVAAGMGGVLVAKRRPSVTELLLFGGTAVGAFLSVRNIPIFAVAAAPIIARWLVAAMPVRWLRPTEDEPRSLPTVAAGAAIGLAAGLMAFSTIDSNAAAVEDRFPVAAVDWLEDNGVADGRIFNAYNYGGYLIWREIPVYVDGRADVYGDAGLLQFGQTYFVEDQWQQPLDTLDIDIVMVESNATLAAAMADEPGWDLVYDDGQTHIFARS